MKQVNFVEISITMRGLAINEELDKFRKRLPAPNPKWPFKIRNSYIYINEHIFDSTLTIKRVRKKINCSSNFSTRFRHFVGYSPKRYILLQRTKIGKILLKKEEFKQTPIVTIALSIGFNSHSAFSKAIKKEFGVSPIQFKQDNIKS